MTLDIEECAAFLKIHTITAYKMAAAGELPGAKIGSCWVFLKDDLVEYLREQVRQQQAARKAKNTKSKPEPKIEVAKVDPISAFPAIRGSQKGRRRPLPVLPELKLPT